MLEATDCMRRSAAVETHPDQQIGKYASHPGGKTNTCDRCPRLATFRAVNSKRYPTFHNAPVSSEGARSAGVWLVGLAPGMKGANRTGRPFFGDASGSLVRHLLAQTGIAYPGRCRLSNIVRCVPPENRPIPAEIAACAPFLAADCPDDSTLRAVLALGREAHMAVLRRFGKSPAVHPFRHGAMVDLSDNATLIASYHCSRRNLNIGRVTVADLEAVFATAAGMVGCGPRC